MRIGIPKEIKNQEYRIGLTPDNIADLKALGHQINIENNAGNAIGFSNEQYLQAGGTICDNASQVWQDSDMIVKVKEPQSQEFQYIKERHLLFTYLHLAAEPSLTKALVDSKCAAIAYETITDHNGKLPLLKPMSEVAGRMSVLQGCHFLEKSKGGSGILISGIPGVEPAKVTVIGAGIAGINAARMAMGLGARVTILDVSLDRLQQLDDMFGPNLTTLASSPANLKRIIASSDLVIGAVLLPGKSAPKLVTENMIKTMQAGSVVVDIAIDQGGCFETSQPTTHDDPIYIKHGIVHYCVTNMPGAFARTSTIGLTNATFPFVAKLAQDGIKALQNNTGLQDGLNVYKGKITCKGVADDLDYPFQNPISAIG